MNENPQKFINKLNEALKPYYTLLVYAIFFIGLIIAAYKFLIKSPELNVIISRDKIYYPASINKNAEKLYYFVSDSIKNDSIKKISQSVFYYLLETKNSWRIDLINQTDKSLNKISLRLLNIHKLTSYSIAADYLTDKEKSDLLGKLSYQPESNILYIQDFVNLPARKMITIYLWGEFASMMNDESLIVNYDGGDGFIEESKTVTGFKAYLVDYFFEILIALFVSFFFIYRSIIKRHNANVIT